MIEENSDRGAKGFAEHMPKLRTLIGGRLRSSSAVSGIHPDANVLTAFSEKSLNTAERTRVMDHLSLCSGCRDLVILALPNVEDAAIENTIAASAQSNWFRWPVLRWTAVAAGLTVAALAGILELQHMQHSRMVAVNTVHRDSRAMTQSTTSPSSTPTTAEPKLAPPVDSRVVDSQVNGVDHAASDPGSAALEGRSASGSGQNEAGRTASRRNASGAYGVKKDSTPNQVAAPVAQPQIPPSSESVEVAAQNATALEAAATPATTTDNSMLQARNSEPAFSDQATVAKAKPALSTGTASTGISANSSKTSAPNAGQSQSSQDQSYRASAARWTIDSDGSLRRSFDGGQSWQEVKVVTTGANTLAMASSRAGSRVSGKEKEKDKDEDASLATIKNESPKAVWRAVFAAGADVWAGGDAGSLYHSTDGGEQWIRVIPFAANRHAGNDIVSIEFSDSMHGKITTSRPEVWITNDGGQSWQTQQP